MITTRARVPLSTQEAQAYLDTVLSLLVLVCASIDRYRRAVDLRGRWEFGFYDVLIVVAALSAGCTRLVSEDLQQRQKIEKPTVTVLPLI